MPDILVILCNGTVGGEEACFCDVDQALLVPCIFVLVVFVYSFFCLDVLFQVEQRHEPVFVQDLFVESLQANFVADGKQFITYNKVYQFCNFRIGIVDVFGAICCICIQINDILWSLSENVDVFFSNQIANLNVCTVLGSKGQSTIQHEFHVSGSGSLFGSQGDLLGDICCRDHLCSF